MVLISVSAISSQQETLNTETEEVEGSSIETEDMLPMRNSASENILNRIASFEKNLQRDSPDKPLIEPKSKLPIIILSRHFKRCILNVSYPKIISNE